MNVAISPAIRQQQESEFDFVTLNTTMNSMEKSQMAETQKMPETQQITPVSKSYYLQSKPADILDGCTCAKDLAAVLKRATLASTAFGVATSFFLSTAIAGFHIPFFSIGPLGFAVMHIMSVINFVVIMLPFAMLLSWISRYNRDKPYQRAVVDVKLPVDAAFDLCLGSLAGLRIEKITEADTETGAIRAVGSTRPKAAAQDISLRINALAEDVTQVTIESRPVLNAVEALIFGYTLAVDSGQNKRNTDHILRFLRDGAQVSPTRVAPLQ